MPLEARTVRFHADIWSAIQLEAVKQDVSEAEIVRVGTLSYVAFCVARRGDETTLRFDELWTAARRLLETYPL